MTILPVFTYIFLNNLRKEKKARRLISSTNTHQSESNLEEGLEESLTQTTLPQGSRTTSSESFLHYFKGKGVRRQNSSSPEESNIGGTLCATVTSNCLGTILEKVKTTATVSSEPANQWERAQSSKPVLGLESF